MGDINWAVLGTGVIANEMDVALKKNGKNIYAVGTSTNETRLGAVKDIQLAVEKLNLADDLLVMAGDNVLDFSLSKFVEFAKEKNTSCVMCHEENELKKQQKTRRRI